MADNHFNHPVELQPALVWFCHDCGQECFVRPPSSDLTPDEIKELKDEHGVQPWEAGHFTQVPETVKCVNCGSQFATEQFCNDCDDPNV